MEHLGTCWNRITMNCSVGWLKVACLDLRNCASPFSWLKRNGSVRLFNKNGTSLAFFLMLKSPLIQ